MDNSKTSYKVHTTFDKNGNSAENSASSASEDHFHASVNTASDSNDFKSVEDFSGLRSLKNLCLSDLKIGADNFLKLPDDTDWYPFGETWYAFGRSVGLGGGDLESHRKMIEKLYEHIQYLYEFSQEVENKIKKQANNYYKNFDGSLLNRDDEEKKKRLQEELDENKPTSFLSKTNKQIALYSDELRQHEKREWENIKNKLEGIDRQIQLGHEKFVAKLNKERRNITIEIIGEHKENAKKGLQAINRFSEKLSEVEDSLLTEKDPPKLDELTTLLENLQNVRGLVQLWQSDSISLIKQHIRSVDEIVDEVVKFNEEGTSKRRDRLTNTIKETKDILIPKSRFYLIVLLIGMFFSATGELAIMNEFTGKILGIGTLSDQIEIIFQNIKTWNNPNPDGGSAFQDYSNIDGKNLPSNILKFFFLFSLSGLPFVLSFVTKAVLDLLKDEKGKIFFFIVVAVFGAIYILSVAFISTLDKLGDATELKEIKNLENLLGDLRKIKNIFMMPLIASLSLSLVMLGGWLLHQFLKGYESFKQLTGKSFWSFGKNRSLQLEEKIDRLKQERSSKIKELEEIESRIANRQIENEKLKQLFVALNEDKTIQEIDVGTAKETAIEAFKAGYEHGHKSRKTSLLTRIWQSLVRIFNYIKTVFSSRRA